MDFRLMARVSEKEFERYSSDQRGIPTVYCIVKETGQIKIWPGLDDTKLDFGWKRSE